MKAGVLLRKDIRTVVRNRRELFWMIILPIVLLAANFYLQGQALEVQVALVGDSELSQVVRAQVKVDDMEQIRLNIVNLEEAEAARRLEQGALHAYLVLTEDSVKMYANMADTSGAVAEAVFSELVRSLNHARAETTLAELVDHPQAVLSPISWEVFAAGKQVSSAVQLIFSSLFVIMGIMTALSLGQQSISMERDKNTLISLRKSPLTDHQIIWAKLGAGLFSSLLPLLTVIGLIGFLMPEPFLNDSIFYVIVLTITFNSVSLGLLIGSYVRGANEGNGWRFMLTLPAMFLASMPISLPEWVERLANTVPTLVGAQLVRGYLIAGKPPGFLAIGYLFLTGLLCIEISSRLLGREE